MPQNDGRRVVGVLLGALADAKVLNPTVFYVFPELAHLDLLYRPESFLNLLNRHFR